MSAFLKIDRCAACGQERPWEWVPPVTVGSRPLPGTGVWRSTLIDGVCLSCREACDRALERALRSRTLRERFIRLVGGTKPYRDFTFERYRVAAGNRLAYELARTFDPSKQNLYFWGPCGVGKTHLAVATLRQFFARGPCAKTTPWQLVRRVRMRSPEEEQRVVDELVDADVLVLDDVSCGTESAYCHQVLQEILDARDFRGRGGLIVTSSVAPGELGRRWGPAIASRLAGMCRVVWVRGRDHRVSEPREVRA